MNLSAVISSVASPRLVVLPVPSCPEAPYPQHRTPPLRKTAQLWESPTATCITASVVPNLMNGSVDMSFALLPMEDFESWPSCPSLLAPQHRTPPLANSAQTWDADVGYAGENTATAGSAVPNTIGTTAEVSLGPSPMLALAPVPSAPDEPSPIISTPPLVVTKGEVIAGVDIATGWRF
jgi:hypothetical protein